jgi:hypothetical protein
MNNEEKKQYNKALTYHYLKQKDQDDKLAEEMEHRLEKAINKTKEIAEKINVTEEDLDVGVTKDEYKEEKAEKMSTNRTLSSTYDRCTWI